MWPTARVSYEPAGLTPAATSCTSSYLVGPSGASSVCGVTPSPKNGGRRDYMFGIWRAATMLATRRTCGEGPVGMSLCPAGRWRMRGVRGRDLGPAYAGARLLPEEQETLCQREQTLCQREQRPTHAHRCAGLACGARSSPWGGWLREARRWVCCGLRRTGGSSPGCPGLASGRVSSSPYTTPLCWVWGPDMVVLWSCQKVVRCVTVSARFTYLLTVLRPREAPKRI